MSQRTVNIIKRKYAALGRYIEQLEMQLEELWIEVKELREGKERFVEEVVVCSGEEDWGDNPQESTPENWEDELIEPPSDLYQPTPDPKDVQKWDKWCPACMGRCGQRH